MRWSLLLAAAAGLIFVAAVGPVFQAAAAEPEESYFGRPLGYWIGQAKSDSPSEPVDRIVGSLIGALSSSRLASIVGAADALQALGPQAKAAAPALAAKFGHDQGWVRIACGDALAAIGAGAVPAVVETLRQGPPPVQLRAAAVLGAIGPAAKAAVPDLRKVIEQSAPETKGSFLDFLAMIDAEAAGAGRTEPGAAGAARVAAVPAPEEAKTVDVSGDWPQFHGPARDSICRETGLLEKWPKDGLRLLWKIEGLGRGFSTVSIAGARLFTMGDRRTGAQEESQHVQAYDLATQHELWATPIGAPHTDGPRCTPTVDGEVLYALGTEGELMCLETATGKVRWEKNLIKDFGGRMMSGWKYSESPLVDGNRLISTPGGDGSMLVALDKKTGTLIWKSSVPNLGDRGKDGASYASAIIADIAGVRQYLQVIGRGLVSVEASSGRFLWGYNRLASTTANIPNPVVRGDYVFTSNSYRTGSALLKITRDGDAFKVEEVYFLQPKEFENHHGGMVLVGDHIYGGSGQNRGQPVCIELATGKIAWHADPLARGSASVLYADGHILFRYDRGPVAWVAATPQGLRIDGLFEPLQGDGAAWAHPVIHQGKLYLRHGDVLGCYDVRGE